MKRLTAVPAIIVTLSDNGLRLRTAQASQPLDNADWSVVEFWSAFREPKTVATVAAEILAEDAGPELTDSNAQAAWRQKLEEMAGLLEKAGLLVDVDSVNQTSDASGQLHTAAPLIAAIIQSLSDLEGTLDAIGPSFQEQLKRETGIGALDWLRRWLGDITHLQEQLLNYRAAHLKSQLSRLGLHPTARGLKLHIGCGGNLLDDWVNIDVFPAPLPMDIRWGLPFSDGAADYIFISHTLEHFSFPHEALRVLQDACRVIAPDGVLRLIVPDIEKYLRAYTTRDEGFFIERRKTWTWAPQTKTLLESILPYAGAGASIGGRSHKFGYDFDTIRELLLAAGFRRVVQSQYMGSGRSALKVDFASKVASAVYKGEHYSLFVEAMR